MADTATVDKTGPTLLSLDPGSRLSGNLITIGDVGTGKTQALMQAVDYGRETGKKMVIYDPSGEYAEKFYRPGIDYLFGFRSVPCSPLDFGGSPEFEMRSYLAADNGACLFITSNPVDHEVNRPFLTAMLEQALLEALRLPESDSSKVVFVIDELLTLAKLTSLPEALKSGHKHGVCIAAATQSVEALAEIYGADTLSEMISSFRSRYLLKLHGCRDMDSVAGLLGFGSVAKEIATLPELTGYFRSGNDERPVRVSIPYVRRLTRGVFR